MAKRRKLLILKNFISPYRLVISNLPLNLTEARLRKIFTSAVDDERAVIKEVLMIKHSLRLADMLIHFFLFLLGENNERCQ